MISEILPLVNAFEEIPGCTMGENTFWKVLQDITTSLELVKPLEGEKAKEGCASAEEAVVEANHDILQSRPDDSETPDETKDREEMDLLTWGQAQEEEDAELEDPELEHNGTVTDVPTETGQPTAWPLMTRIDLLEKETVVQIGKDTSVTVCKAKLNKLTLTKIVKKG
jgi:hypothetical protein